MFIHYLAVVVCMFMLAIPCQLLAGEKMKSEQLEDVTVTATRTERATDEIPAGVTTVTREEIKNTRMFNMKEALTGIAGVQTETKNGGYDARLIIRGAGLKARYGIREIMILQDGVPITDPDGMSRLDFVNTQLVDRIEVVKGPNSTLYGANAAGGVVNIITRSPYEEAKSLKMGYGSYNTQLYNLIYGTHVGDTYITLSGSRRSTDSWREWNKFSTSQGGVRIGHIVDSHTSVEAAVNYTRADIQLPGSLTESQFEDDITQLTSDAWRNSGRYSRALFTNLKLEKEIGNVKLKPVIYYQNWKHYHPVTGLINKGGANVYGGDFQSDVSHNLAGMGGVLTVGLAGQIDDAKGKKYTYEEVVTKTTKPKWGPATQKILYTTSDSDGDLAEETEDMTTKWGLFAQESLRPSDKWIIDLGIRYDQVTFDIDTETFKKYDYRSGNYINAPDRVERKKDFEYVSPKVGVVYKLNEEFSPYVTFSTGFQTPQSSELSVNPDLKPLKVYNYEGGLKGRFKGGHSFDLSLFYMKVKDEIVQITQPGSITDYSNAGETTKQGLELSGKYQVLEGLFLGGAYTYNDFKYDDFTEPVRNNKNVSNVDRSGNRLPYIPAYQYTVFAYYKHPSGLKFKVDTNTWGEYHVDNANSDTYDGYAFITNALAGYEQGNWDVAVTVYNVFNKKHAMEVSKDTSGVTSYRPGAPLTWLASVGYKF